MFEKFHILLYFSGEIWYNKHMKSTNNFQTSNPETVTVSRAEYEEKNAKLAAQDERIAELEQQVSVLMEALRLARHKQFGASSEKISEDAMEQLSFLFNEARSVRRRNLRSNPLLRPPVSSAKSTVSRWRTSPRAPLLRWWSTVWRARIWYARNAAIP